MESNQIFKNINIPNFSGPLEVLLDLAKSQKVNLADISITLLADQFLEFVKISKDINLEKASEYLVMATWLAYLKSKLLLPDDGEDDFKALEVAERLKLQLKKLELIRLLSDQMLKRKRIGRDIFYRGQKGGIRSIKNPVYKITLYEILKSYAVIKMQSAFRSINIPKLPVLTSEEGIKSIKNNLDMLSDWTMLGKLIPTKMKLNDKMIKSGIAGIFAASLELSRLGEIKIKQAKMFDKLFIKKS